MELGLNSLLIEAKLNINLGVHLSIKQFVFSKNFRKLP